MWGKNSQVFANCICTSMWCNCFTNAKFSGTSWVQLGYCDTGYCLSSNWPCRWWVGRTDRTHVSPQWKRKTLKTRQIGLSISLRHHSWLTGLIFAIYMVTSTFCFRWCKKFFRWWNRWTKSIRSDLWRTTYTAKSHPSSHSNQLPYSTSNEALMCKCKRQRTSCS